MKSNARLAPLVVLLLGGCGSTAPVAVPHDSAGTAAGALTVVEQDESAGKLVLSYRLDGRELRYEMRLGPAMQNPPSAQELAAAPDLPTYQTDVRVLDHDGNTLMLRIGGDTLLDATWREPVLENIDGQARLADFALMRTASSAFQALEVPASLEQLRRAGLQAGLSVPESLDVSNLAEDAVLSPDPELIPGQTTRLLARVVSGSVAVQFWLYQFWNKAVTLGVTLGHHTSARVIAADNGHKVVFFEDACNHGSCASDSGSNMKLSCSRSTFLKDDGTHSRYFMSEGSRNITSPSSGACLTKYDATSVGGHNCNDDSEIEARAVAADSPPPQTGGTCNNSALRLSTPSCAW